MAPPTAPVAPVDTATLSNYKDIHSTHLHLELTVDWAQRILRGSVEHTLTVDKDGVVKVVFDTAFLAVKRVHLASSPRDDLAFSLPAKRHPSLGSALTIELGKAYNTGDEVKVVIEYATTDECSALGWLEKEQTGSGKYPFVYAQCQAIHARSLLPCQDTPGVKATYTATVHSSLPILLSALRVSPPLDAPAPPIDGTVFTTKWNQPVAIPSYLFAIVGGELVFKPLGERTGVWAEPGMIDAAAWEFEADTERMVATAEELFGPFVWTRYDMVVLPASFPYGGMEVPGCVMMTPALIVGDRSQVDVVAHELSHMWHGNLVSCAEWDSFWLNEGWTVYSETAIAMRLHGQPMRDFEYLLERKSLSDDLKRYDHDGMRKAQRLHIPYKAGEDPDDFYSSVAYHKGANFLYYLEKVVGGFEVFNAYQKDYIRTFAGKSISTADWEEHFWAYWGKYPEKERRLREEVDFDAWINGEGLDLPVKMEYDTSLADASHALAARWASSRSLSLSELEARFSADDLKGFSATQTVLFLETLETEDAFMGSKVVDALEKVYGFESTVKNPEIKLRWYAVALKAGLYAPEAATWVRGLGRMKYARPTYRAIFKVDPELAKRTFLEYGVGFLHPIARRMVAQDLGLEEGK
ncbi:Leucyl aminopeptidase yscIV [Rhodotorula kratochvilovae]